MPVDSDPPFDSSASLADVILRSSDDVDFYISKTFLSFTSVVFKSMFSIKQPEATNSSGSSDCKDGLPVVKVEESSMTLRVLLPFCLPGLQSSIDSFESFVAVRVAAVKYCMDAIISLIDGILEISTFISDNPLRMFAVAFRYGWEAIGREAAKASLALPFHQQPLASEFRYISGEEYHKLEEYRAKCAERVAKVMAGKLGNWVVKADSHWLFVREYHAAPCEYTCRALATAVRVDTSLDCDSDFGYGPKARWDYVEEMTRRVVASPRGTNLSDAEFEKDTLNRIKKCTKCWAERDQYEDMAILKKAWFDDIEEAVSEVTLDVEFLRPEVRLEKMSS